VREGLELRFGAKVEITGTVTDSRGEPVAGVRLLVTRLTGSPTWNQVYSDVEGKFRFENVEPGRVRISVDVGSGRREHVTEPFDVPASEVAITYDPPKKVTIEGVVVGPDGKPIELCNVSARSNDGKPTRSKAVYGGTFSLQAKGEAPFAVWVSNPRLTDGTPMNLRGASTSVSDPDARITLRLEAGAMVSGRVLGPDDKGVANVVVVASGGNSATSDEDGTWRIVGLARERVGLQVKPPAGFITPQPIVAAPGESNVEFRLQKSTIIRGRVLLPEGVTMRGGQAKATWVAQGKHAGGRASGTVKQSGIFSVQGMPPEVRVSLEIVPFQDQATSPRLAPTTVEDVLAGRIDVEVILQVGVAVSGSVVNADGSPFTQGTISLTGNGRGWSQIDDDGKFRAEGLRPGTFDLLVFGEHGPRGIAQEVTAPASGVRIVLAATGMLSGKLIGAPDPASWGVRAVDPKTGRDAGRSLIDVNADGTWKIGPIDEGRPWVVVASDKTGESDRYARSAPVEVGADDVRLTLKTGASIQGRVEREGNAPPQCWIRAQGSGWQAYTGTDGDGAFTLRGVPPGRYTLTAGSYALRLQGTREGVEAGAAGVVIELDQPQK